MLDLPIRYALFDMDGTLTDTMRFWRYCLNEVLEDEGIALTEEQIQAVEKLPFFAGLRYVRSLNLSPRLENITREDLYRVLERHYVAEAEPKPGVVELLEEYKARGVKMGVATLSPTRLARVCLTRAGLIDYFSFVLGPENYPDGKNTPKIFFDAAEMLGCDPSEMYLFEDTYNSIKTAVAAGIPVVGVADKFQMHNREEIFEASVAFLDDGFKTRLK